MAKVKLEYPFSGLSGRLGDVVYVKTKKEMVDDSITNSYVYVRKHSPTVLDSIKVNNIRKAFSIVAKEWAILNANNKALATWQAHADTLEKELRRYTSAYVVFMTYYMTAYAATLGTDVLPVGLSSGTSLDFTDRASRKWS